MAHALLAASHLDQAQAFLDALLQKDEETLSGFADVAFFPSGHLEGEVADFLYTDHGEWKSIVSIASAGKLEIVLVPQGNGQVMVLYVLSQYRGQLNDQRFLSDEWMKKYFACQFSTNGARLKIVNNFCFAETDGPYPSEAG